MADRGKNTQFKQYWIWIRLLTKRLWKQPAYIGLLLFIPVLGYAIGIMERSEPRGAVVAVYVEEGVWSGRIVEALQKQEEDGVLHFDFCRDELEVERCVMKSDADCGFVIPEDLASRVPAQDWRNIIKLYETSGSSITGMAKERIASIIFRLYSEQCYEDYMRDMIQKLQTPEKQKDISNQAEIDAELTQDSERAVEFARNAYEKHLLDGTTFGFQYKSVDRYSQENSDTDVVNDTSVFPIKGVFAVLIFISGMCGLLEYDRDRREKRFFRLVPNRLTYIVDIWMPTFFVSAAVLVCLWISDGIRSCNGEIAIGRVISVWDMGMWGKQIFYLFLYQCVLVVYCGILGLLLRRQETVAAAIPVLSLGSLVCAPVFVRLSAYMPVFVVLEKLFPVTYYLLM